MRGSLEFVLDSVEARLRVCGDVYPWVIFVCVNATGMAASDAFMTV
jgi:hypothetical protein